MADIAEVAHEFGVRGDLLLAQLVNFLFVLLVLWRFAYRPVLRMLKEREDAIAHAVTQAEETAQRAAQVEHECAQLRQQARTDARAIMTEATQRAEIEANRLRDVARVDAQRMLTETEAQLAAQRTAMLVAARAEMATLVVDATRTVLAGSLDDARATELAADALARV